MKDQVEGILPSLNFSPRMTCMTNDEVRNVNPSMQYSPVMTPVRSFTDFPEDVKNLPLREDGGLKPDKVLRYLSKYSFDIPLLKIQTNRMFDRKKDYNDPKCFTLHVYKKLQ